MNLYGVEVWVRTEEGEMPANVVKEEAGRVKVRLTGLRRGPDTIRWVPRGWVRWKGSGIGQG